MLISPKKLNTKFKGKVREQAVYSLEQRGVVHTDLVLRLKPVTKPIEKIVYIVRHTHSNENQAHERMLKQFKAFKTVINPKTRDAEPSPEGFEMLKQAQAAINKRLEEEDIRNIIKSDVYVSNLKRAQATWNHIFGKHNPSIKEDIPKKTTEIIKERVPVLEKFQKRNRTLDRYLLRYIIASSDKKFLTLVGHSVFFKQFFSQKKKMKNCQILKYKVLYDVDPKGKVKIRTQLLEEVYQGGLQEF